MNRSRLINIGLVIMLMVGVGLLLYPTASDWWNSTRQTHAIAGYVEAAGELDTSQQEALFEEARAYNAEFASHVSNGALNDEMKERYEAALDVTGTGVMGYVEIPVIGCSLPIYHGTEDSVLQVAIGHLEWSSLPVGGEGTHCVVSGHRGLPSARLFTDLDKLSEGDVFELHILGDVLAYEVERILIVEPNDTTSLAPVEGEDLCTLVTCTPYGVNTHRLLVTGHRVEWDGPTAASVVADATQVEPLLVACALAVPVLVLLMVLVLVGDAFRRKD